MKKIYILLIALICIRCTGSNNNHVEKVKVDGLGSFDLTPDNKSIIFAYTIKSKTALYKCDINGLSPKLLLMNDSVGDIFNPKCSPDGKKVVFIATKKKSTLKSSVWIINADGSELTRLTDSSGLITEATFSNDNDLIYYCTAKEVKNYSPIVSASAHDFDIYSVNIESKNSYKLSNLHAYGIQNIVDFDSERLLIQLPAQGVYFYNKNSQANIHQIAPKNNKNVNPISYSNPVVINQSLIGLVSYYQLIVFSLPDMSQKVIFSTHGAAQFNTLRSYKKENKLIFTLSDDSNNFYSIDFKNGESQEIHILLDNEHI